MPKIDLAAVSPSTGCNYPAPYAEICLESTWRKLGDAAGLTDFGVNLVRLAPGRWSSQRHWHELEDEYVMMLEGEVVLMEDGGETVLRAGDHAGFPRGVANGHHLQNRTAREAVYLEIGSRRPGEACHYPDIDLEAPAGNPGYVHKDGAAY